MTFKYAHMHTPILTHTDTLPNTNTYTLTHSLTPFSYTLTLTNMNTYPLTHISTNPLTLTNTLTHLQPVEVGDEHFWSQFWSEPLAGGAQDIFALIPAAEIRALREESPSNLATLCYKAVERLVAAAVTDNGCSSKRSHQTGMIQLPSPSLSPITIS